ncbi:hypothetical protein MPSEU_001042700 [Mayamaea pseudoterrestris]|nr:hypothetical protein MPSEU_001042700 [Mayamaea pseudoterrestris]
MQPSARDDVYSHFVARRAVARAGLHVGLDSMSNETLDALSGVLLAYLERVGASIAASVQASGRSSAHVNVLDAIAAAEQCTSAAVMNVHLPGNLESTSTTNASNYTEVQQFHCNAAAQDKSWKGLAAFCFGPDWQTESFDAADNEVQLSLAHASSSATLGSARGGKLGPSSTLQCNASQSTFRGWNAPYPDEVPRFPVVLGDAPVANPHALPEHVGQSLVMDAMEEEKGTDEANKLDTTPDALFTSEWGTLNSKKRSTDEMDVDNEDGPSPKKLRFDKDNASSATDEAASEDRLFIPCFFPDYPKATSTMSRTVLEQVEEQLHKKEALAGASSGDSKPDQQLKTDPTLQVRSALVSLDRNEYWGSTWQQRLQDGVTVPAGRSDQPLVVEPLVVPLLKPSGTRISKILEGSMEPSSVA